MNKTSNLTIKDLKKFGFNTDNRTYIVAEIGINHRGSVNVAKKLIESAAKTGADAVKFQTYLTEKRAPKNNKEICIKCIPILPESIEIDNNNNIHIHLLKNKDEIFINQYCNMQLTEKINFKIHSHEINFMPIQTIILKNNGISKISNANIYDNKVKSDIIITLQLY